LNEIIFISSVQKEFKDQRRAIRDFVRGDPLLRRFFDVFLFEDVPASDRRTDKVYLDEVRKCGIYVGLFGDGYGAEDKDGISPTEREFDLATSLCKVRLIFVKGADDTKRHPKMRALIDKACQQVTRRRFSNAQDLITSLYASLVEHLDKTNKLRTKPFDMTACMDAKMADISQEHVKWFLNMAPPRAPIPAFRGYSAG